ncbi:MAG: MBL fold metallo-hydrolase [Porticoccaceae bacterium]|nr:MBL fold metallo-hydrolase [Porticoccaceae bacterium]
MKNNPVLIRQLFDSESSTYTYLVADTDAEVALLIDPVSEKLSSYIQLLADLSLELKYALDTHCHADHITALGQLRDITSCETLAGKPSEMACVDRFFGDGDILQLGSIALRAIYTPGHTDDSYCFFLDGEQQLLFTGDTLLIRGTGRTDFQNGSSEELYDSLFTKLLKLPDQTIVFPGHDYKGWTQSTIFEERQSNPRLQVKNWQELDSLLEQLKLMNPKLMDIAIPANKQCGKTSLPDAGLNFLADKPL